jgi:threonine dehydratase
VGAQVFLKFENLQFTASFKERGASNKLQLLSAEEKARGVIAMSAGNHAQGVAYHAQRLGLRAVIVMPRFTPGVKVERTRGFGAEVVLHGDTLEEARQHAYLLAEEQNLTFVHPFDDEAVAAGQGTLALEMLAQPDLDTLVVAIGGGGLIAGWPRPPRRSSPASAWWACRRSAFRPWSTPCRARTCPWASPPSPKGIAVATAGTITREVVKRLVDELLLVDEGDIEQAVLMLLEIEKTLVEGAGAAGLAALIRHREKFAGQKVGLVLSGGNIDPLLLAAIIERGMVRSGRWRASASARAMCPACWPRSPPPWPPPAPTSRKCTTSAPSRCWPRRTWKSTCAADPQPAACGTGAGSAAGRRHAGRARLRSWAVAPRPWLRGG